MTRSCAMFAAALLALTRPVAAQNNCPCPPEPKPGWRGSLGGGLAVTSGNTETRSYNVTLGAVYDPLKRNVVRLDGLYLESSRDGEETADKAALGLRDEYKIGSRGFVFGEARYQRDRFKRLTYLVTPAAGIGYRVVDRKQVVLAVDAGVGLAFEKLDDRDATGGGALRAGETLSWKLSGTGTLTHTFAAIWKTEDLADAFYHLELSLSASVARHLELKLSALSDVKNRPALPGLKKRDDALLAAVVFKIG